ncbi:MAG: STAS domain-containing protein [Verrucomicrobiae bacterium]|nr:STAS domain-containing protein [Verrucomicrobiae bacterium]
MSANACPLEVCLKAGTAVLRVNGRASMKCSPEFKRLLLELYQRGTTHFVLDLSQCDLMDSTFLGVLLGFAIKTPAGPAGPPKVELYRPGARVKSLFETLGVMEYFPLRETLSIEGLNYEPVCTQEGGASKTELAATSLEAHQNLMAVNPANVMRFKDVVKFLEEDLGQQGGGHGKA